MRKQYKECHNCPYDGKCSEECLKCQYPEQYNYRYNKYVFDDNVVKTKIQQTERVTDLNEEVEDKFRQVIIEIFSMSSNELLMMQSIIKGQSLTEYADNMNRLSEDNKDFSRHRAYQTRKAIATKYPHLKLALLTSGQKKPIQQRKLSKKISQ